MLLDKLSKDDQIFIKSFIYTVIIQGTNLLFPLFITPFIINKVGLNNYSTVAFVQSLILNLNGLVDYGFSISGVKSISQNRNDNIFISKVVSVIYVIKISIAIIISGLLVIYYFINKSDYSLYSVFSIPMLIGQALFPLWFYQGFEKLRLMGIINVIFKVLSGVLIILIVEVPQKAIYVNMILGLGTCCASLVLSVYMFYHWKISLFFISINDIVHELKYNWDYFISNYIPSIYIQSSVLFLGLYNHNLWVGYYASVEKIINAVRQILVVFFQTIYPRACIIARNGFNSFKKLYYKFYFPFLIIIFLLCLSIYIYADFLVKLIVGSTQLESTNILKILSFMPFIVALNIPFNHFLLIFSNKRIYSNVYLLTLIFYLIINLIIVPYFKGYGAAYSLLATELTCSLLMIVKSFKVKIKRN